MLDTERPDPLTYLKEKGRCRKTVNDTSEMNTLEMFRYLKFMNKLFKSYKDPKRWNKIILDHIKYKKPEIVNKVVVGGDFGP